MSFRAYMYSETMLLAFLSIFCYVSIFFPLLMFTKSFIKLGLLSFASPQYQTTLFSQLFLNYSQKLIMWSQSTFFGWLI